MSTPVQDWIEARFHGKQAAWRIVNEELMRSGEEGVEPSTVYRWAKGERSPRGKNLHALYRLGFERDPRLRDFLVDRLLEEGDYSREEIEAVYPLSRTDLLAEKLVDTVRQTLDLGRLARRAGERLGFHECCTLVAAPATASWAESVGETRNNGPRDAT